MLRTLKMIVSAIAMFTSSHVFAAGDWIVHGDMLRTRLIAAAKTTDGKLLMGWEAELADGWKTYWRSPGEAGLPVIMEVAGENIELEYPLPERFELFGLETYGYAERVVIPFYVDEANKENELTGTFMVCKDICIPFDADYGQAGDIVDGSVITDKIKLDSWLKKVPEKAAKSESDLSITAVRLTGAPGYQRLVVDVASSFDLNASDMLAEVGDNFHFGTPSRKILGNGKQARFVLKAMAGKGMPDLNGETVRLTFTDGQNRAIDQNFKISY